MSKAKLGTGIVVDIGKLLETRMLIQANSGGGKSYAIRKLLEETHGKVQQIVLDMEGEFSTLREKFDFVLAGKGGDVDADPKTAELLARKILEHGVSLIVDLYELKKPERIRFVRNFVEALVNAPKELWHPTLVLIDEAHVFVPEKGESEAASAVIDLATRGRKRGFAAVLATQRLAKLNKDVAAECLNKLIGRTSLDIDRKRAADELGFLSQKDSLALRTLRPGQFYTFGPAIHDEVSLGTIDPVVTTHLKAGQRLGFRRTRPTAHIKEVLKKLTDLPKEAELELKDRVALQRRVKELEQEIKKVSKEKGTEKVIDPRTIEKVVRQAKSEMIALFGKELEESSKRLLELVKEYQPKGSVPWTGSIQPVPEITIRLPKDLKIDGANTTREIKAEKPDKEIGRCERKILGFLFTYPNKSFSKVQVGAMTGYRHSSGGFNNALSRLMKGHMIKRSGGKISAAPDLWEEVQGLIEHTPHQLEDWISKLGACERAIYQKVLNAPDECWDKERLAQETGYSAGSGGFNNALSRLNTLGLIQRDRDGISLNPEVAAL